MIILVVEWSLHEPVRVGSRNPNPHYERETAQTMIDPQISISAIIRIREIRSRERDDYEREREKERKREREPENV